MIVLEAFFDESERDNGTFCVAGYIFSSLQVERFSKAWHKVMGPYWPFHMTEFDRHRDKTDRPTKFESLTDKEHDALLKRAVQIINQRIMLSISVACNTNDVRRLSPIVRGLEMVGSPLEQAYSLCCYQCMMLMSGWLRKRGLPDRVAYLFESGNRFQRQADYLMELATYHPVLKEMCRYQSHGFAPKTSSAPLQAADLFAWELTKFLDETVIRKISQPRESLISLVRPHPERYEGRVLHASGLERYFKKLSVTFAGGRT
ncbi:MAG TPA: DUF3800 domain-containing protein [Candidatus Acidoferrum sp.]|nr:DUF3800 domain-containing protein [Candidatus Acidoferrum sp.]